MESLRTACFVDGYNLFYGLLANTEYKWLDMPALLSHIIKVENPTFQPEVFKYFTSGVKPKLATRGTKSVEAQNSYIRALKAHDVEITMGRHTLEPARAPRYDGKGTQPSRQNQLDIWKLEEKETDVSIAISMYRLAAKQSSFPIEDRINHLVLVSADTDMSPALQAIREDFPDFHIGVILPHREGIKRTLPGSLQNQAHWMRQRVTLDELKNHQFPDRIPTKKKPIIKPDYW